MGLLQAVDQFQIAAGVIVHRVDELRLCLRDGGNLRRDDIAEILQADIPLALHAEAGNAVAGHLGQEGAGDPLDAKGEAGMFDGTGVSHVGQAL